MIIAMADRGGTCCSFVNRVGVWAYGYDQRVECSYRYDTGGRCVPRYSAQMARPIEATPQLCEEDSRALLASLERRASPEAMQRRREAARRWRAEMMRPKL